MWTNSNHSDIADKLPYEMHVSYCSTIIHLPGMLLPLGLLEYWTCRRVAGVLQALQLVVLGVCGAVKN